MSTVPPHIHALRAAFQACRPRASCRIIKYANTIYRTQHQQTRSNSSQPSTPFTTPSSSSVSADEVSHFSRLASSWWDPHGPSRLLHLMNPLRHDFLASCLASDPTHDPTAKRTYLDIGCGGGIFATSAARKPHTQSVTAIDPTPEVIAVAKAKQRSDPALSAPKLTYLNCAIEDLPAHSSEQYDIISLFEVIEHIDRPSDFLDTALQHLKPGGWLIGSTISRHPIAYVTTKLIAEAPLIGVVPRGTHDWNKYITPSELKGWFEKQRRQRAEELGVNGVDSNAGQKETSKADNVFGPTRIEGVVYVPVLGWKFVKGSEEVGNYFFGVQKLA